MIGKLLVVPLLARPKRPTFDSKALSRSSWLSNWVSQVPSSSVLKVP
jgi:hypothetical protein